MLSMPIGFWFPVPSCGPVGAMNSLEVPQGSISPPCAASERGCREVEPFPCDTIQKGSKGRGYVWLKDGAHMGQLW